jgi:hypothetical protein
MNIPIEIQPLPRSTRKRVFLVAVLIFLISLPFLYMYATGYRFDNNTPTNFISTGGLYIAVERSGAQIYIDEELMRETRTFRKAFYAQGISAGTHRVHVQKDGYHTWVKELPVSKRLVTEAEAFNFPLVPHVRVISPFVSATGTAVVTTPLKTVSSTNELLATTTKNIASFSKNIEYQDIIRIFNTISTSTPSNSKIQKITDCVLGTDCTLGTHATTSKSSVETATTTKQSNDVRLYETKDGVFASWKGSFEQMPYYYCASDFPRYSTTTSSSTGVMENDTDTEQGEEESDTVLVMHPVQTVTQDVACDPTIHINVNGRTIYAFDFFPSRTDLVLVLLDDGVYVTEIDDRAWQNIQPFFLGTHLTFRVLNGSVYIFDGSVLYQVLHNNE